MNVNVTPAWVTQGSMQTGVGVSKMIQEDGSAEFILDETHTQIN